MDPSLPLSRLLSSVKCVVLKLVSPKRRFCFRWFVTDSLAPLRLDLTHWLTFVTDTFPLFFLLLFAPFDTVWSAWPSRRGSHRGAGQRPRYDIAPLSKVHHNTLSYTVHTPLARLTRTDAPDGTFSFNALGLSTHLLKSPQRVCL